MIMKKNDMDKYQPKLIEVGPVTVTVGGIEQPPAPSMMRIDVPKPDKLIQFRVAEGEEADNTLLSGETQHLILDEDALSYPDSKDSDKKKKQKNKETDRGASKKLPVEKPMPNPAVFADLTAPTQKKSLTEYALVRILKERYCFGCYGSALYVRNEAGVYCEVNCTSILTILLDALTEEQKDNFSSRKARQVRDWLLADSEIKKNQLIFPKRQVLFTNGCFDIVAKTAVPIYQNDFFVTRIDARYLPDEDYLPCPHFDAYLESTSGGDKGIQRRICAMIGYLLLPGYPGKKILVLGTAKNSGKSVIARFIQRLVGAELVSGQTPFDMTENHALSEFSGKIANMAMDVPAMVLKPSAVGLMKTLSGGDMVSMNPKGLARRSQICFTKQVIGTNASLQLQVYDEAFWTRVVVIPYIYSIPAEDQIFDLEEHLYRERHAVVTKCMKAARQLIKNNYEFPECTVAEAMKDLWIGWRANAEAFLRRYCVEEEGSFTSSTVLFSAYSQYCAQRGIPCGEMAGFIRLAKKLFPTEGNARVQRQGVQKRGLPGVRFTDIST